MDEVRTVAVTAEADRDKEVEMICRAVGAGNTRESPRRP